MEVVLIFVIFLTPLIFFHELGHFLFARLFGVKVETFSIGFGPKILKKKKGDTEYAISIIPLGGYIKMFGDDPVNGGKIPIDQRKEAFVYKSKWARFWIVFGGPLANFILAYVLYFFLLASGEKVPEAKFGVIPKDSVIYNAGFRPGDVIKKLNGKEVLGLTEFTIRADQERVKSVTVGRHGEEIVINADFEGKNFVEEFITFPRFLRRPIVVDRSGQRFGVSRTVDKINWYLSLDEMAELKGDFKLFLFPLTADSGSEFGHSVDYSKAREISLSTIDDSGQFFEQIVANNFHFLDTLVKEVKKDSPASRSKLKVGDIIYSVEGKVMYSFEQIRQAVQASKEGTPLEFSYFQGGEKMRGELTPEVTMAGDKQVKTIGIYSGGEVIPSRFVNSAPKGIGESFILGFSRTWGAIESTVSGFAKLFTGQTKLQNVGGPLMIGKVASDSFKISISYFLGLMALVSINLGVINLLPIPVLDGGHILFIFLEILNRGPLSRRKMEIAQQFGLSVLLLLIIFAVVNDISRIF